MPPRASSARSLAWIWIALTVYASLHPFSGWQLPLHWGLDTLRQVLTLPVPRRAIRFDVIANFLAYIPLGALLALARLRRGRSVPFALLVTLAAGAALSYSVECLQHWLPMRYPSMYDWLLNTAGTAVGALLAWLARACGLLDWWQRRREAWFVPQVATGLSLMLSWPAALLFPPPLPLGLGQASASWPNWWTNGCSTRRSKAGCPRPTRTACWPRAASCSALHWVPWRPASSPSRWSASPITGSCCWPARCCWGCPPPRCPPR